MAAQGEDNFDLLVEEVQDRSSDLPLRSSIYERTEKLLNDLEQCNTTTLMNWVTEDVVFITSMERPDGIRKGKDKLLACFNSDDGNILGTSSDTFTAPVLIVVDRGRVTCHMERVQGEQEGSTTVDKTVFLIIFDLDYDNKIERVEYRLLDKLKRKNTNVGEELSQIEKKAIDIDHHAFF